MSVSSCCLKSFRWGDTPVGETTKLAENDTYVTGSNPDKAVLIVHDILGWEFPNVRLLADHYARELDATVYVPDFFNGDSLPSGPILAGNWHEVDVSAFIAKNTRETREPEIFDCARALRQKYKRVAAVGFCYGGWAVFCLGAKQHAPVPLVDCIVAGHPTFLTEGDIDHVGVPVQLLAPEHDPVFTSELKRYSWETILKLGVPFDYQHFPGVEHGCLVRGDSSKAGERDAMARGKSAAVAWMKNFLGA